MQGLTPLGDGRYRFRCYVGGTKDGRRVQETWGLDTPITFAEAKRRAARLLEKLGSFDRSHDELPLYTISELAREVLELRKNEISEATRKRYELFLLGRLGPFFGSVPVSRLKPADWKRYEAHRLASSFRRSERAEEASLSHAVINRERAALMMLFNSAVSLGLLERNPFPPRSIRSLHEEQKTIFFKDEEWTKFLSAFDDFFAFRALSRVPGVKIRPRDVIPFDESTTRRRAPEYHPEEKWRIWYEEWRHTRDVFEAILLLGGRLSDVLALTWDHVDFERSVILLRQPKVDKKKSSQEWKVVPIVSEIQRLLDRQIRGIGPSPVFRRLNGSSFSYQPLFFAFEKARRIAGLRPELTIHKIRHTVGYRLERGGHPLKVIQEVLGHRSLDTTTRYVHCDADGVRAAFEAINAPDPRPAKSPSRLSRAGVSRSGDVSATPESAADSAVSP